MHAGMRILRLRLNSCLGDLDCSLRPFFQYSSQGSQGASFSVTVTQTKSFASPQTCQVQRLSKSSQLSGCTAATSSGLLHHWTGICFYVFLRATRFRHTLPELHHDHEQTQNMDFWWFLPFLAIWFITKQTATMEPPWAKLQTLQRGVQILPLVGRDQSHHLFAFPH